MNNKLKNLVKKIKTIYGEAYSNYTITMIMVNISTLVGCVYTLIDDSAKISYSDTISCVIRWILMFFIFLSAGCLCIESLGKNFYEKNGIVKKTIGVILAAAISGALVSLITGRIFGCITINPSKFLQNFQVPWTLAYFVLIVLITFYVKYKESGFSLEKYFVYIFTEMVQIGIAWGVLALGFLLLSVIFETLIGNVIGLFALPQVLIMGLFVAPRLIMSISGSKEEIGRFFEVLIKYVALIITIVGAAIIYLYIIKLIFTGIPSNEIFGITSALFFVAIPVGFACTAFDKDTTFQKIAYVIPYIYAPFIILQGYSIIVRILDYGVTPSRYMGIVLIVLEVIYTVIYAFFRKHIEKVILVMMAITIIITLIPGVNINAISRFSQKGIIKEFVENGLIGDSDVSKKRVTGAYDYLRGQFGDKYLSSILSEDDRNKILELKEISNESTMNYYSMECGSQFIPTDGYAYIVEFSTNIDSFDENGPSNMTFMVNDKTYGPFDMSKEYESVKNRCIEENTAYLNGYDVLKISDDEEIIFTKVNINEDGKDNRMVNFSVKGYYLVNDERP